MADVDSLSSEFVKYDQVRKTHTYRLAESSGDAFDEDATKLVDLARVLDTIYRGGRSEARGVR